MRAHPIDPSQKAASSDIVGLASKDGSYQSLELLRRVFAISVTEDDRGVRSLYPDAHPGPDRRSESLVVRQTHHFRTSRPRPLGG